MRRLISQLLAGVLISTMGTAAIAATEEFKSKDELIKLLSKPVTDAQATGGRGGFGHKPAAAASAKLSANSEGGSGLTSANKEVEGSGLTSLHILFARGSANILPGSRSQLDQLADALRADQLKDSKILIVGHTDSSGTPEVNLALSMSRAASVRDYLVQNGNVPSDRLATDGKGQSELANPNDPLGAENRRVVFANLGK
jgi:outer membrane protein OmpA-like peptidoglycan-associated protein